jgi:hypothetical protein
VELPKWGEAVTVLTFGALRESAADGVVAVAAAAAGVGPAVGAVEGRHRMKDTSFVLDVRWVD